MNFLMKIILCTMACSSIVYADNTGFTPGEVKLNEQIQAQLKTIQEQQQQQLAELNKQLQTQIQKLQSDTQEQLKQLQAEVAKTKG